MEVIEAGGAEGSKLVRQASTSSMADDKVRYSTSWDKCSTCLQLLYVVITITLCSYHNNSLP